MPSETHIWTPNDGSESPYELESLPGSLRFKILAKNPCQFVIPGQALRLMPRWQRAILPRMIQEELERRNWLAEYHLDGDGSIHVRVDALYLRGEGGFEVITWWI